MLKLTAQQSALIRRISDEGGSHRVFGDRDHRPFMELEKLGLLSTEGYPRNVQDYTYALTDTARTLLS